MIAWRENFWDFALKVVLKCSWFLSNDTGHSGSCERLQKYKKQLKEACEKTTFDLFRNYFNFNFLEVFKKHFFK